MLLYLVRRFQRFLRNLKSLSWCRARSVGVFENIGEFIQFANLRWSWTLAGHTHSLSHSSKSSKIKKVFHFGMQNIRAWPCHRHYQSFYYSQFPSSLKTPHERVHCSTCPTAPKSLCRCFTDKNVAVVRKSYSHFPGSQLGGRFTAKLRSLSISGFR